MPSGAPFIKYLGAKAGERELVGGQRHAAAIVAEPRLQVRHGAGEGGKEGRARERKK